MSNFKRRIQRLETTIDSLYKKREKLYSLRLWTGLLLIASFIGIPFFIETLWLSLIPFILLFSFLPMVKATARLQQSIDRFTSWRDFYQRQLLKKQGQFQKPAKDWRLDNESVILANDINLRGDKSLLHLLDECSLDASQKKLLESMVQPKLDLELIKQTQSKIKSWSAKTWQLVKYRSMHKNSEELISASRISEGLENRVTPNEFSFLFRLHLLLFPLTWLSVILIVAGTLTLPIAYPIIGYAIFSLWSRSRLGFTFTKAQDFLIQLSGIAPQLLYLEKLSKQSEFESTLKSFHSHSPKSALSRLQLINSVLSVYGNPLVVLVLSLFLPFDYVVAWWLEKWRSRVSHYLQNWLKEMEDFEVHACLTFLYSFHTKTFAEFSQTPELNLKGIYHPLISTKDVVENDFSLPADKRLILISGSNMSGKSTFIRTLAINHTLALMGAPVFAQSMTTYLAPMLTCLRVTDSLKEGYSTFYYEVSRIRELLKAAQSGQPLLYFVDEIFRGTNNRERFIGAQAVIRAFNNYPSALGFISTHDLELTQLDKELNYLSNYHFRDEVEAETLTFTYKMHSGPCPTTNALKIMRAEGLPIPDESQRF